MKQEHLIVTYDQKCGFNDLYLIEKERRFDLSIEIAILNEIAEEDPDIKKLSAKEIYLNYEDHPEDIFDEDGPFGNLYSILEWGAIEHTAHTYLKEICYPKNEQPYAPGIFEMFNIRLSLEQLTDEEVEESDISYDKPIVIETLKAKEAMAILNVSRQTLSNYVKKGLIETVKLPSGHYLYKRDSVIAAAKANKN